MTQANMDKKLSHYDTKVCEQGRQESLQWVKRNAWLFDGMVLVSNTQERCRHLYNILDKHNHVHAGIYNKGFNERDFRQFVNKTKEQTIKELSELFPVVAEDIGDNFSLWMDQELVDKEGNLLFENNKKLQERTYEALINVDTQFPGKDMFLITSSGVLRSIQSTLLWMTSRQFDKYLTQELWKNSIPNLGITEFFWNEKEIKYELEKFNIVGADFESNL